MVSPSTTPFSSRAPGRGRREEFRPPESPVDPFAESVRPDRRPGTIVNGLGGPPRPSPGCSSTCCPRVPECRHPGMIATRVGLKIGDYRTVEPVHGRRSPPARLVRSIRRSNRLVLAGPYVPMLIGNSSFTSWSTPTPDSNSVLIRSPNLMRSGAVLEVYGGTRLASLGVGHGIGRAFLNRAPSTLPEPRRLGFVFRPASPGSDRRVELGSSADHVPVVILITALGQISPGGRTSITSGWTISGTPTPWARRRPDLKEVGYPRATRVPSFAEVGSVSPKPYLEPSTRHGWIDRGRLHILRHTRSTER